MPAKNLCTECSLAELNQLVRDAERRDQATLQLLARPRTFFIERGYFLPLDARVDVTHTEELQARLQTQQGVDAFVAAERDGHSSIKIHIKNVIAYCGKVVIK